MTTTSVSLQRIGSAARTDNAFVSEPPLQQNHARMLAISKLRLPTNVEMIGGIDGRKPSKSDVRRFADLLEREWNVRHHEHKTYEQHCADVQMRFDTISAPTFVAYGSGGWPDAVLFPIRTNRTPANDLEVLSPAYWNTDFSEGTLFSVRKSVSDNKFSIGFEKKLIEQAFIPYARALAGIGEVNGVFFYSWHLNGTFPSEQHKQEMEMHRELGAIPARIFQKGRIEELIYSHLLG